MSLWNHKPIVAAIISYLTPIEDVCLHRALVIRRHVPFVTMLLARLERILDRDYTLNAAIITVIMWYVRSGCAWLTLLRGEPIDANSDFDFVFRDGTRATVETFCTALVTVREQNHAIHVIAYNESGDDNSSGYLWIPYSFKVYSICVRWNGYPLHGRHADFNMDLIMHDNISYYLKSFDMSFCANALSGNGLIICDADAVVRKKCVVNAERYLAHPMISFDVVADIAQNAKHRIDKLKLTCV